MTDPITDMLNRIRNGQAVLKETVSLPFSQLKYDIAKVLEKQEYIEKVDKRGRKEKKILEITLRYSKDESTEKNINPVILGLKRVSKPGQRIYTEAKKIRTVRGGYGIAIISTSKGLMSDKEARKQNLGGEIICEIW